MKCPNPIVVALAAAALFACHREGNGPGVPPPPKAQEDRPPTAAHAPVSLPRPPAGPPVAEEVASELAKDKAAFARLPDEEQARFRRLVDEAGQVLRKYKPRKALALLNEARRLRAIDHDLLLFRGLAWMQLREHETACRYFERGLRYYPEFTPLQFNLAECEFMRGRYAESEALFAQTLGERPELPLPTLRILEFKSLLCLLKLEQSEEARRRIEAVVADGTPFDRYAKAAWRLKAGPDDQARSLLASARSVFTPAARIPYEESLIACGLIDGQLPPPPVEEDAPPGNPGEAE